MSEIAQQRVESQTRIRLSGGKSVRRITWMGFSEPKNSIMVIGIVLPRLQ